MQHPARVHPPSHQVHDHVGAIRLPDPGPRSTAPRPVTPRSARPTGASIRRDEGGHPGLFIGSAAISVESAGTFDADAELELWFSGLGKVKFEFSGKTDVAYLNKLVAHHVL